MENSSLGYVLERDDQSAPTYNEMQAAKTIVRRRHPVANLGSALVLGFTVITSHIAYVDPRRELRQSGSASTQVFVRRLQVRRVSLEEAWDKAARVYAVAQQRRTEHLEREAREFLWSLLDDDE